MSELCEFPMSITIGGDYGLITPVITSAAVSYWDANVPEGTYRISYVNGAMKYSPTQGWALNARALFAISGFVVKSNGVDSNFPGTEDASYPSQAAVEAANAGVGVTVIHPGGPLGMYLSDDPTLYGDNVAGDPTPTFSLTKIS